MYVYVITRDEENTNEKEAVSTSNSKKMYRK